MGSKSQLRSALCWPSPPPPQLASQSASADGKVAERNGKSARSGELTFARWTLAVSPVEFAACARIRLRVRADKWILRAESARSQGRVARALDCVCFYVSSFASARAFALGARARVECGRSCERASGVQTRRVSAAAAAAATRSR